MGKNGTEKSGVSVDWHYSGGVAQVLYLGDEESRKKVEEAIEELAPKLKGTIMKKFEENEAGLYRKGVSTAPYGSIGGFFDGGSESTFIPR